MAKRLMLFSGALIFAFRLVDVAAADSGSIEFPTHYVAANRGHNDYRVSPALELANILVAVGYRNSTVQYHPLRRKPAYYQKVIDHFSPHAEHPVFAAIGIDDSDLSSYIKLRNSSYRWYPCAEGWCEHAFLGRWWSGDGYDTFGEHIELIAEFARESGFEAFFEAHRDLYREQAERYRSLVDLDPAVDWLTRHFGGHYDNYTVLFSPLILGNQTTTRKVGDEFSQVFMIVDPPSQSDDPMRALGSFKWVFTELDHQFVNPSSEAYAKRIAMVFDDRDHWTAARQSSGYRSPQSLFNEYMTWAVWVAYVDDHFDADIAAANGRSVIEFMHERRGFPRFGDFVTVLRQAREDSDVAIAELYPRLIDWAEQDLASAR